MDVLRGLDPDAEGVFLFLFDFADAELTISDITFDITPAAPAELVDPELGTAVVGVIRFGGERIDSTVERVTIRGHEGDYFSFLNGGFNIVNAVLLQPYPDPPMTGVTNITRCTFEHAASAVFTGRQQDSTVRITRNRITDVAYGMNMHADYYNSVHVISHNEIREPHFFGIYAVQRSDNTLSWWIISHNTIEENASGADGIGLVDAVRANTGVKALDAVVYQNWIRMDTPYGGIFGWQVEGGAVLNNIISGEMDYGIALFGSAPDWIMRGNNVQNVDSDLPIYLGPGTVNTTVVGGSNRTNVVDDTDDPDMPGYDGDNFLTGVNVQDVDPNLGESVAATLQQRCADIAEIMGSNPCWGP